MPIQTIEKSTFVDLTGYRITSATTAEEAYGITDATKFEGKANQRFNVGLMLKRNQDPTSLLEKSWGERQKELRKHRDDNTLWTTYGADPTIYNKVTTELAGPVYNLNLLTSINSNYVSGPESRMIWVEINTSDDFKNLFGKDLHYSESKRIPFWKDELSLPSEWNIEGIWLDLSTVPPASNMTPGVSTTLPQGPQSIGNNASNRANNNPQQIANLYNFPLQGNQVVTGTVGLIEPGVGTYLPEVPEDKTAEKFASRLNIYLSSINQVPLPGAGGVTVQGVNGQTGSSTGERSIDVGVVAGVNPNSLLALYNGSGASSSTGNAQASVFTAAQSAIWDLTNNPAVTSNSWGDGQSMAPKSPFYAAYKQMFLDAALQNQTTVIALGDGGSGNETHNGLTNVEMNVTQATNLVVGGTSLTQLGTASSDPTLTQSILPQAQALNPAILWSLMRSGLSQSPTNYSSTANPRLLEAVWNTYVLDGSEIKTSNNNFDPGYQNNNTSSGGVDPSQHTPSYQVNYGLTPTTTDILQQVGRGVPDVAANAGGNMEYTVPGADMKGTINQGGTSAAAPFWASLLTQINTIFQDQGLSNLGYCNDLLYTTAVVAPAAFNDIDLGNNISSYTKPGDIKSYGQDINPTGFGYQAGPNYDLTSGLGSPNGTLLAIALTNIAHSQLSSKNQPAPLQTTGQTLSSSIKQSLLWQTSSAIPTKVDLQINGTTTAVNSAASGTYAWTSQLAQQSLQATFDPALLKLFDGQAQGALVQTTTGSEAAIGVTIGYQATSTPQFQLSNPYGFTDFITGTSGVRAARAVSIATTPGDLDNQQAVVRLRQNGTDNIAVFFYRVDDLTGSINGVAPGSAGYTTAAQQRRYAFSNGETSLQGSGYGNYSQGLLQQVDAGDIIAMGLQNQTSNRTYWGFAQANEVVNGAPVGHLWNYGMNTFGFEDLYGGGDRDFNDAILQLDFSSASGSQYLL